MDFRSFGKAQDRFWILDWRIPVIAGIVVLAGLTTIPTESSAADKIRISMTGFAGQFMTFPLAQKRGFLKEEGFDAEIIRIAAAATRPALTNGDIDYSTGIGGTSINAALSGVPIRVVACFVPVPVLGLVARPEFKTNEEPRRKQRGIRIA